MIDWITDIVHNNSNGFVLNPLPTEFMDVLILINSIFAMLLCVLYLYQNIYAFIALFTRKRKCKKARAFHKYAYVICAHDEDKVVGNLVDSILKQDYPTDMMKVFVVADNCNDNTAEVARNAGAIVFERKSDIKGKSYALDYAIKRLLNEYEDENFEAMFVFDADNLVAKDYTLKMNDLFDHGIKVATSFRESKNFNDNWVSAGSSMCFYRECVIVHHARSLLNVGTYVSGTGYYIDYNLVKEMGGWNYHTMVEDIEFSCDCANKGIKIGFCEDAIFYDEQPTTFKSSVTQRLRWCKGTHQCFYKYKIKRHATYKHKFLYTQTKYEMRMHISPLPLVSFAWTILYLLLSLMYVLINKEDISYWLESALSSVGWLFVALFGVAFIHAIIVTIKRHKIIQAPLYKQILYCFTFPVFAATFLPLSMIALFKKVTWQKVEHNSNKTIDDMIGKNIN